MEAQDTGAISSPFSFCFFPDNITLVLSLVIN